jgi:hypothetical protein
MEEVAQTIGLIYLMALRLLVYLHHFGEFSQEEDKGTMFFD